MSSNPRKRTATTTVDTGMTNTNQIRSTNDCDSTSAKRNKFENTPVISSLVQQTEYTILDVQRLLHVMETTTPSSTTPVENSWKDYEIRAALLQDMYTSVCNKSKTNKKNKQQQQQQLLLDELQPRIRSILQVTKDYILTLQKESPTTAVDPFEKLFPSKPPAATGSSTAATTTTLAPSETATSFKSETVSLPPPSSTKSSVATNNNKKKPATDNNSNKTMVEIQQQQREQMEVAVSQMAEQLKRQTQSMNEQIQQQNHQMIDELQTTMEQNVQDVTKVAQLTQDQVKKSSRRSYSTWTMIILMTVTFVMTFLFILTIPKPTQRMMYTKYIKPTLHSNSKDNSNETHICRLLPSGIEECYYIPDQTNRKEESKNGPESPPQSDEEVTGHTEAVVVDVDAATRPEENVVATEHPDHEKHIDTVDLDQLYNELRRAAVFEINVPFVKQLLQAHPSLLYYTDPNGWSLLHELARSGGSSSSAVQDRMEMIQYIVEQNATLIQLVTNTGLTPYDLATNSNDMNEQPERETILTLLRPEHVESKSEPTDDNTVTDEEDHVTTTDAVVDQVPEPPQDDGMMDDVPKGEVLPEEDSVADEEGPSVFEMAKHAIAFNDLNLLRTYVEEYPALLQDVDENDNGMSLLHYAVRNKNAYDTVQFLVDASSAAVEEDEEALPIWAMTTFGIASAAVAGEWELAPQTPYEFALDHWWPDVDMEHPILQLLQGLNDDDESVETEYDDDEEEVVSEEPDEVENEIDSLMLDIPNGSEDALEDALREFEEMKRGWIQP